MRTHLSYFICTTPRTGSTFLCEAFRSCEVAGKPEEYFWYTDLPAWYKHWGISTYEEFIEKVLEEGSTPNGVFGAKLFVGDYLDNFLDCLSKHKKRSGSDLTLAALLQGLFPGLHYVWLTRRDKVRQAVSWLIAFQTNVWWVRSHGEPRLVQLIQSVNKPSAVQRKEPEYDFERIDALVQEIVRREAAWQDFFRQQNVLPLTVVYEDFVGDCEGTILLLLEHLGVDAPKDLSLRLAKCSFQKQASSISDEWVRRYLEEKRSGWQPAWHGYYLA